MTTDEHDSRSRPTVYPAPDTDAPTQAAPPLEPPSFEDELRQIFRNVVGEFSEDLRQLKQIPALVSAVETLAEAVARRIEQDRKADATVDQIVDYLHEIHRDLDRQGIKVPRLTLRTDAPPRHEGPLQG